MWDKTILWKYQEIIFFQFGYAPKGSSVIMYRCKEYIHSQYFISTKWSGNSITRISHLLFRSEFLSSPKSNSWRIIKVAFCQKVWCGSKRNGKFCKEECCWTVLTIILIFKSDFIKNKCKLYNARAKLLWAQITLSHLWMSSFIFLLWFGHL